MLNLDMDEVLVGLVQGINKSCRGGRPLTLLPGIYDLNDIFNFDAVGRIECATAHWWANLPRTPWASDLVECILERFEPSQIRILTRYVSPACAAGKIVWMKSNYPRISNQITLVSGDKSFACQAGDILIDDYTPNIDAWCGHGILVPQTWNTLHGTDVMTHIENALSCIRDTEHG